MEGLKRRKSEVASIEKAPTWMVDNTYLKSGYRINFKFKDILKSIFQQHNELMNIWTHLCGMIVFLTLIIYLVLNRHYSIQIYKELKQDFQNYHVQEKLKDKFTNDIVPFIEGIRNKAQIENLKIIEFKNKTLNFFEDKYNNYYNSLKDFKKTISAEKLNLSENFDASLEKVNHLKNNLIDKIIELKLSSQDKFESMIQNVELWFEDHKKQILDSFHHDSLEFYPIIIYCLSALSCLTFSTVYHTFYPLSKTVNGVLQRLDMAGISILIFGSTFAANFYFYYCEPLLQIVYMSISFVTCFGGFAATMYQKFHQKEYTYIKGLIFGAIGVGNGFSMLHVILLTVFDKKPYYISWGWIHIGVFVMGTLYLTGLTFYIKKFPEKYFPKTFDIWLNSHTIFHIFVFLAAIEFFFNIQALYEKRRNLMCEV